MFAKIHSVFFSIYICTFFINNYQYIMSANMSTILKQTGARALTGWQRQSNTAGRAEPQTSKHVTFLSDGAQYFVSRSNSYCLRWRRCLSGTAPKSTSLAWCSRYALLSCRDQRAMHCKRGAISVVCRSSDTANLIDGSAYRLLLFLECLDSLRKGRLLDLHVRF